MNCKDFARLAAGTFFAASAVLLAGCVPGKASFSFKTSEIRKALSGEVAHFSVKVDAEIVLSNAYEKVNFGNGKFTNQLDTVRYMLEKQEELIDPFWVDDVFRKDRTCANGDKKRMWIEEPKGKSPVLKGEFQLSGIIATEPVLESITNSTDHLELCVLKIDPKKGTPETYFEVQYINSRIRNLSMAIASQVEIMEMILGDDKPPMGIVQRAVLAATLPQLFEQQTVELVGDGLPLYVVAEKVELNGKPLDKYDGWVKKGDRLKMGKKWGKFFLHRPVDSQLKKLAPFFYEIPCGEYSPEKALKLLEKGAVPKLAGRCSGFRSGDFHGRNLDWNIDRTNYYFVRTPEKPDRFATIGIAQDFGDGDLELIPVAMMDGINSQGVVVEVNVVPAGDRGITTGTKPGAPRMGILMVTRHLLDHAKSAAHAVELFDTVDLFGDGQHEMHWMISDLKETYVVEIVNNRIKSVKHPIMTNFYVTESPYVKPDGVFTPGSAGIERYERLKRHLGKIDSVGAMLAAMKEEWYTLVYTPGRELDWWSEFNDYQWTDSDTGKKWHFKYEPGDKEDAKRESHIARLKCMQETQRDFNAMRTKEKATGEREDTVFWQTVDSGCYDIRNRRLSIRMQESDPLFEFSL